ncbi:MAG: hypothetical protein M3N29_09535 [Chloroflexota bacterium]|nr:hypothetical protein [Chloroflexota bacterium]
MTAERVARLVARWVRFYTRKLPAPIADRRINEIEADLHDHIAHERAHGTSDRRIALSILSRMVRGITADASWRRQHAPPTTAYRSIVRMVLVVALMLMLPLLAMHFSDDVVWSLSDFAVAGALLLATGLMYQFAARKAHNFAYRAGVAVALGAGLFLVWVVLAVGAIGVEGDPADLMYLGVLGVGTVGAVIARFQPEGMARAVLATAFAQALVAVIALIAGKHEAPTSSVAEILGVNAFFVALFIGSAWLFRRAARQQRRTAGRPPG